MSKNYRRPIPRIGLAPEWREAIETQLEQDLIAYYRDAKADKLASPRTARLLRESAKLLEARYPDAIPLEVFQQEQTRIKQGLDRIDSRIAVSDDHQGLVAINLDAPSDSRATATPPTPRRPTRNAALSTRHSSRASTHRREARQSRTEGTIQHPTHQGPPSRSKPRRRMPSPEPGGKPSSQNRKPPTRHEASWAVQIDLFNRS